MPDHGTRSPRPKGPRSLADLLASSGKGGGTALGRLAAEADRRLALLEFLRNGLDPALKPALLSCNLREDGTLVLTTPSAAWAARLRFEGEALLRRCRERQPEVSRVRVRVVQDGPPEGAAPPQRA